MSLSEPPLCRDVREGRMSRITGRRREIWVGFFRWGDTRSEVGFRCTLLSLANSCRFFLLIRPLLSSTLLHLCLCRWQAEGRPNQSPTVSFFTRHLKGSAFNHKTAGLNGCGGELMQSEFFKNKGTWLGHYFIFCLTPGEKYFLISPPKCSPSIVLTRV